MIIAGLGWSRSNGLTTIRGRGLPVLLIGALRGFEDRTGHCWCGDQWGFTASQIGGHRSMRSDCLSGSGYRVDLGARASGPMESVFCPV